MSMEGPARRHQAPSWRAPDARISGISEALKKFPQVFRGTSSSPMKATPTMKTTAPRTTQIRLAAWLCTALAATQLCSCIQPPPPRTYNPAMARHLRSLSHDTPVTPLPGTGGAWIYECY
jgi:hypothetical protein